MFKWLRERFGSAARREAEQRATLLRHQEEALARWEARDRHTSQKAAPASTIASPRRFASYPGAYTSAPAPASDNLLTGIVVGSLLSSGSSSAHAAPAHDDGPGKGGSGGYSSPSAPDYASSSYSSSDGGSSSYDSGSSGSSGGGDSGSF